MPSEMTTQEADLHAEITALEARETAFKERLSHFYYNHPDCLAARTKSFSHQRATAWNLAMDEALTAARAAGYAEAMARECVWRVVNEPGLGKVAKDCDGGLNFGYQYKGANERCNNCGGKVRIEEGQKSTNAAWMSYTRVEHADGSVTMEDIKYHRHAEESDDRARPHDEST